MGKIIVSILLGLSLSAIFYGVLSLGVRLHMTQQAYAFEEVKDYERSLEEEQRRLRADLVKKLSPIALEGYGFEEPKPDQIVRLP